MGASALQVVAEMNQNVAKMNNIRGEKKGIVGRQNVLFPCYQITEPEADDEFTGDKEAYMSSILATYQEYLQKTKLNLGYCLNLDFDYSALGHIQNFVINNCGDPFIETTWSGHSRQFEVGVLDWFARLWEIEKNDYWGYVTNGGTEGNLHGILVGRELYPDGILYTSKDSHYSIFKAARMYRMSCIKVDTLVTGEIDCAHFKAMLLENKDKPAIINVNLGTTVKGAIDDLDIVIQTLEECGFQHNRFYIHCDGALHGLMLPFFKGARRVTFKKPIGSVCISGHKFIGCPMPCGVQMTRLAHISRLSRDVEYIASRDATITGSRSGHAPIFLWYALNRKGYRELEIDTHKCLRKAQHLRDLLKEAGLSVMLNEFSNIVVFERPQDEDFIRRWQLACEGNISHVVIMPSDTSEKLETFIHELLENRLKWLKDGDNQVLCVAPQLGRANCVCDIHK